MFYAQDGSSAIILSAVYILNLYILYTLNRIPFFFFLDFAARFGGRTIWRVTKTIRYGKHGRGSGTVVYDPSDHRGRFIGSFGLYQTRMSVARREKVISSPRLQ